MEGNRIIDRLDAYMKAKGYSDTFVQSACGLSNGTLNKSRGEGRDLSRRATELVLKKFQDINRVWLTTGVGEMELAPSPPMEPPPEVVEVTEYGTKVYDIDATCGDRSRPIELLNSRNHCDSDKGKHIFRIDKKRAVFLRLPLWSVAGTALYQVYLFSQGLGDAAQYVDAGGIGACLYACDEHKKPPRSSLTVAAP